MTTSSPPSEPAPSSSSPTKSTPMPPSPHALTLIVATTPTYGIGLRNTLPWPQLKAEMAYFARITKRVPPAVAAAAAHPKQNTLNAVIMGRKTWDSIPGKFRPLKGRLNIVLTRSSREASGDGDGDGAAEGPRYVGSLAEALRVLDARREAVGRVFVIGGAEVYAQALRMEECTRVLRTRVAGEFECDVRFPVDLEADQRWRRAEHAQLSEWVGESVPEGEVEQDGVRWEYQMWERT